MSAACQIPSPPSVARRSHSPAAKLAADPPLAYCLVILAYLQYTHIPMRLTVHMVFFQKYRLQYILQFMLKLHKAVGEYLSMLPCFHASKCLSCL